MENEKRNKKKLNNKGFSLVELIIVMAIMAILVGVVGTQVIPYMNRARESKDYQIVSSFGTAAMTAYTTNIEKDGAPTTTNPSVTFKVYTAETGDTTFITDARKTIKELTYNTTTLDSANIFDSPEGKEISDIEVTINLTDRTITVKALGTDAFDPVVSKM